MRIRRATPGDLSTTATFSVPAFIHDELYRFSYPFAARYPEDFRQYYLRKHKQRNAQAGYVFWVAILDPADEAEEHAPKQKAAQVDDAPLKSVGDEKVVGYAIWHRYGQSEQAKSWQSQTWAECRKSRWEERSPRRSETD
ncbi:MAG: hypothetical protein LQ348_005904 [Seirophora lacunosa]|nr:MAG: hypothetical protein LQ348_005904 [Seirophora lacunosa]